MATRSKSTGEGTGSCLICGDSKNIENSKESKSPTVVLLESIQVYFTLRHVLELPSEQLQSYLRSWPHPEKWVKICSDCDTNYVSKCKQIFKELMEVKRRFHEAKMQVVERIKKSVVGPEKERAKGQEEWEDVAGDQVVLDIWTEVRTFVQECDYGTCNVDPFQAGDLMARKKAAEMTLKGKMTAKTDNKGLPIGVVTIPSLQNDDNNIKTEPSSPSGSGGTKFPDGYEDQLDDGPNSENDQSGASEESCSEYDPSEAAVSPSSCPDHSNVFEKFFHKMHSGNATLIKTKIRKNQNRQKSPCKLSSKKKKSVNPVPKEKVGTPKKILRCPQCEWKTTNHLLLIRHLRKSHADQDAPYTCDYEGCQQTFPDNRRLTNHFRSHKQPRNFRCDLCPRQFLQKVTLESHKKLQHNGPNAVVLESFQCSLCDLTLLSKQTMDVHLYNKHRQEKRDIDEQTLTCDLCPLTFVRETCLQIHKRKKHRNPKTAEKKEASVQCSECGQMYSSKNVLNHHMNVVHTKNLQVNCDLCGVTLHSRYYMKSHLRLVHNIGHCEPLKHLCAVEGCGKRFQGASALQRHVAYVHEGQCKFQCETCGKRVITQATLRNHIEAMHTNREEKPWKCEDCGKAFAIEKYLRRHKRTHLSKEAKSNLKAGRQPQQ